MLGKKDYQEKLFLSFSLSQRIPENNFYRRLKETLDLGFIHNLARPYYGKEGQKSIDPAVFFRLMLIGYLENITSDRQLVEHVSMRLDLLYFIDYDIDEPLPWHSTLSRTRKLLPDAVFEEAFNRVLGMCVDSGMVCGTTQAIDSAYIKANASLDSLEMKHPVQSLKEHIRLLQEINQDEEENDQPRRKAKIDHSTDDQKRITVSERRLKDLKTHQKWFKGREGGSLGSDNFRARYLSNMTHYSPVDPDARVAVKPGKPRQMYYSGSISVDTAHHVITHIRAIHADRKDSLNLIDLTRQTRRRLKRYNLQMHNLLADTGFSNGENYKYLEQNNIRAYIPVHGQYEGTREGFTYEPEQDRWRCSQGKYATFRKIKYQKNHPDKLYYTTRRDCKGCPLASGCIGRSHEKRISMTVYKEYYDRAMQLANSKKGRYYKVLRQSTVEPVFGTLINFTGMRKINTRGIESANKVMLMAAMAYNLRKFMKFNNRIRAGAVMMMDILRKNIYLNLDHITIFFGRMNDFMIKCLFRKNQLSYLAVKWVII